MKNALQLNWPIHQNLAQNEWPAGVLEHTYADLILAVSELREEVGLPQNKLFHLFTALLMGRWLKCRETNDNQKRAD